MTSPLTTTAPAPHDRVVVANRLGYFGSKSKPDIPAPDDLCFVILRTYNDADWRKDYRDEGKYLPKWEHDICAARFTIGEHIKVYTCEGFPSLDFTICSYDYPTKPKNILAWSYCYKALREYFIEQDFPVDPNQSLLT